MKRLPMIALLTLSSLSYGTTAAAHHSFVMFDRTRIQQIAGTVKEFEMLNPHGWLRILVADARGAQNEWSLELGGPVQLERFGLTHEAVHPGDKVVVQIHPLRDGSYGGQLISVTQVNGRVLGERTAGS